MQIIQMFIFMTDDASGFTRQWAATADERVERRQVQVEANQTGNQNRPAEYRTVTAPPPPPQTQTAGYEEERKHKQCVFF